VRGQAYTLEAVIASLLLVSSLVFALQVTAVTPLSASTSNQHIENQQRASASGVLTAAQEAGALNEAVLYWNDSADAEKYYDAEQLTYYTNSYPPNEFGNITERAFDGRGLAVNVLVYHNESEEPSRMVYRGEPSDNAVSASRTVTIYNGSELAAPETSTTVENATSFDEVVPYDGTGGTVYNVVRVEVTVWRM
jgi:hypothetical protein